MFKYVGLVLDESSPYKPEYCRKKNEWEEGSGCDDIICKSWESYNFNVRDCFQKSLVAHVLMYRSETVTWCEKERFVVNIVQMDKFRGILGIRRTYKMGWVKGLIRVFSGGLTT